MIRCGKKTNDHCIRTKTARIRRKGAKEPQKYKKTPAVTITIFTGLRKDASDTNGISLKYKQRNKEYNGLQRRVGANKRFAW